MNPIVINSVTIDCLHPKVLADFYKNFLGWSTVFESDDFVSLSASGFPVRLGFQLNEDYTPPVWPERPDQQQQMEHGAIEAANQFSEDWIVMFDPEGHPFCIDSL